MTSNLTSGLFLLSRFSLAPPVSFLVFCFISHTLPLRLPLASHVCLSLPFSLAVFSFLSCLRGENKRQRKEQTTNVVSYFSSLPFTSLLGTSLLLASQFLLLGSCFLLSIPSLLHPFYPWCPCKLQVSTSMSLGLLSFVFQLFLHPQLSHKFFPPLFSFLFSLFPFPFPPSPFSTLAFLFSCVRRISFVFYSFTLNHISACPAREHQE